MRCTDFFVFLTLNLASEGSLRVTHSLVRRDLQSDLAFLPQVTDQRLKDEQLQKSQKPLGTQNYAELATSVKDTNDNAPFLDMGDGLVWYENQPPGVIGHLWASNNGRSEENGPPFTFQLGHNAQYNVTNWFSIRKIRNKPFFLIAKKVFYRALMKHIDIPINVCDRKGLCAADTLRLTIGDNNGNPLKFTKSKILVYYHEDQFRSMTEFEIGQVYVQDWDLENKTFKIRNERYWEKYFGLNKSTGMVILKGNHFLMKSDLFTMKVLVEDPVHNPVGEKAVLVYVTVYVKKISKEAILNSGSMRIKSSPEGFVRRDLKGLKGYSKREKFMDFMSMRLNYSSFVNTLEAFTIVPGKDGYIDVLFTPNGYPRYEFERVEEVLEESKEYISSTLGFEISMIHIDECLHEGSDCEGRSCSNYLDISGIPIPIQINEFSFTGIGARVKHHCSCKSPFPPQQNCSPNPCLNNGTCQSVSSGYKCHCPSNNTENLGPNCEQLAVSFNGLGWTLYPRIPACSNSHMSMHFNTLKDYGTLVYIGPSPDSIVKNVTDFMALELHEGQLRLFINFGSGTKILLLEQRVDDGKDHEIILRWTNGIVQMQLDNCTNETQTSNHKCFIQTTMHNRTHLFLNAMGPLHVGGVAFGHNFQKVSSMIGLHRSEMPNGYGFVGYIRNLTFSAVGEEDKLYDLGNPFHGKNFSPDCDNEFIQTDRVNTAALNIILGCFIVALILVFIMVSVYCLKRQF